MALVLRKKNTIDTSIYLINRTAIDSWGRVGSLYDAYQDRLLGQLDVNNSEKLYQYEKFFRCGIVHANNDRNQNLLRLLSIDEQLRLSILLKFVPNKGIASVIDYPYPTNQYTRLLCYSYIDRIQRLPDIVENARKYINSSMPQSTATHIITNVEWGIDLVVVLQLPPDAETRKHIDLLLKKIYTCLYYNYSSSLLISDEENLLQKILHIKVYSNIPDLCNATTLYDVCYYIEKNKNSTTSYPIMYSLRPIQWFYTDYTGSNSMFHPIPIAFNDNIEQYIIHLTTDIKILETFVNEKLPKLFNEHLKEQFSDIQNQWIEVKNKYTTEIDRISKLIIDIRSGRIQMLRIDQAFPNHEEIMMKNYVRNFTDILIRLEEKGHLIHDLERHQIQYYNMNEFSIDQTDYVKTIEEKLVTNDEYDRIICSNDTLNKNHPVQLNLLCYDLVELRKNNSNLRLSYADFSYSSSTLNSMMILPSNKYNNEKTWHKYNGISSLTEIKTSASLSTNVNIPTVPALPTNEIINILLLGETGVGKSTFINAFVNYLTFKTLKQAQSEPPITLIPVSFPITINDTLDKHEVKFGDLNNSHTEDFDHPGQSITQHCKSYIFHLGHSHGRKLRIIDAPGFGDIRGVDQDDINMHQILEYLHNSLTHLNAICFFFKANALHLHKFFQSCLTHLFSLLHADARHNIIFCFTNGRSTFYTPGYTTSLLKNILTSFSMGEIPFEEQNTFCFDNESFRYLVALQNKIPFSDHEKQEYEMSWSISKIEINRWIDYISKNLNACQIRVDFQTIRHAQFEIVNMIRPVLETIRNMLRNTVLWNMDSPNKSIELRPKVLECPVVICLRCKPHPQKMDDFWIANIPLHEIENECRTCQCSLNYHIQIPYILEHEFLNNSSKYDRIQTKNMLDQLCYAIAEFCDFLINVARSSKNDPFLVGLVKMMAEETYLSRNFQPNYLNLQLVKDLKQLQNKYEQRKNAIARHREERDLLEIYALINAVQDYPMVREQVAAVKEGQKIMMKQHEYEVSHDPRSALLYPSAIHRNSTTT